MKVLFLMIAYPDVSVNTNMYTELTNEFLLNGHEVFVAAPGSESTKISREGGIDVLRIKTLPLFNTSLLRKGIANLLLPFQYRKAIDRYFGKIKFDLIITATPPITFSTTAKFLKKKNNARFYLILRDIFPQNAKDLGIIRNPVVFKYFRNKEKKLYRYADAIGCMSPGNIEYVHRHNPEVSISKLHLLPNWTNVNVIPSNSSVSKSKFGIEDKFVAIFGGNFGIPQKMDFLIEVAELIANKKEILFILVGEGTEKSSIHRLISEKSLLNIRIFDQMPREDYLQLLRDCDVGLVNLSDKFTIPNIPSRTLSYWSLKLPVLAAVDGSTDYGSLLEKCDGGLWSVTGDTEKYISNLLFLYENPEKRKQMGENGYKFLVNELNSDLAYRRILASI